VLVVSVAVWAMALLSERRQRTRLRVEEGIREALEGLAERLDVCSSDEEQGPSPYPRRAPRATRHFLERKMRQALGRLGNGARRHLAEPLLVSKSPEPAFPERPGRRPWLRRSLVEDVREAQWMLRFKEMTRVEARGCEGNASMEVTFEQLSFTTKDGVRLLDRVSGALRPGRLAAIMGPSGAGKTVFLSCLLDQCRGGRKSGTVRVNGRGSPPLSAMKSVIGIVPQADCILPALTVWEVLMFSACCRLPPGLSRARRIFAVENTLAILGLADCKHRQVGGGGAWVKGRGLSGGQRKRVNVGMELVAEPLLLLVDEPTSGLDSSSARQVVAGLQQIAGRNVTVATVLHQPSSSIFGMLDDVLLLARGGQPVYSGPRDRMEPFFAASGFCVPERVNPADFYLDAVQGLEVPCAHNQLLEEAPEAYCVAGTSSMVDSWRVWERASPEPPQMREGLPSLRDRPSAAQQYLQCLQRAATTTCRMWPTQLLDLLFVFFIAAMLAYSEHAQQEPWSRQDQTNEVLAFILLSSLASLRTLGGEVAVARRDFRTGLSRLAYYAAKDHGEWVWSCGVKLWSSCWWCTTRRTCGQRSGTCSPCTACWPSPARAGPTSCPWWWCPA